jgi:hypothetical protein
MTVKEEGAQAAPEKSATVKAYFERVLADVRTASVSGWKVAKRAELVTLLEGYVKKLEDGEAE